MRPTVKRLGPRLAVVAVYAYAAWFVWLFLPGSLSLDSLAQYEQALSGAFDDHHPPLPAICVRGALRAGLGLEAVVALQALAGLAGVHCLVHRAARLFGGTIDARARAVAEALVLAVLVSPITPLLFHLTTFWKDTWFATRSSGRSLH